MSLKTATYRSDSGPITVEYDSAAPCRICNLPVVEASMGGTDVCPWCDCGVYRDNCRWEMRYTAEGFMPRLPHSSHSASGDHPFRAAAGVPR
jgi:hypothetical protein